MDSTFVAFVLIAVDPVLGFGLLTLLAITGLVIAIRFRASSRVCPQCGTRVREGLDHCMSCGFDLGTSGR